ncbi:MAG: hypothetical protein IPL39_08080 [Opitutaceae bacterium]|nr:hypothetical protein [Opitutaceae bacterium]
MNFTNIPFRAGLPVALAAIALLSGCTTYTQQTADFHESWKSGQLAAASIEIDKKADKNANNQSTVVWSLEQGAVYRARALENQPPPVAAPTPQMQVAPSSDATPSVPYEVEMTRRSIDAFNWASDRITTYDEQAKAKVASEAGAILTNPANLSYRGRASDRIMLETYQALNFLKLGEFDNARVALNRVLQHQRDAVEANAQRIAEAQAKAADAKEGKVADEQGQTAEYDTGKALEDEKVAAALQEVETELETDVRPYEVYVNPFAVFLDGLFFMTRGDDSSDMERARKSIERVAGMAPDCSFLREDLQLAEGLAYGKKPDGLTYVVFETGSAPSLDQLLIPIPLFLVTSKVDYMQCALPRLKRDPFFTPAADITVDGESVQTQLLCSMDSVVAREFKNEWPAVLTKSILSAGVKGLIQYQVKKELKKQGGYADLIGSLVTSVYTATTTIADTRSWTTLPKQFQYARFATPQSRTITIAAGGAPQTVALEPGKVNLVYVKNVAPGLPALISQTVLK